MKLRISSRLSYTVEIVAQPIGPDGPAKATIDEDNHVIQLKSCLTPEQRRRELRHEFFHAMDWHWQGTRDGEQATVFSAHCADEIDAQMEDMGGWRVLDELYEHHARGDAAPVVLGKVTAQPKPGDTLPAKAIPVIRDAFAPKAAMELARPIRDGKPYCGRCEIFLPAFCLVDGFPRPNGRGGAMTVFRQVFCRQCVSLLQWTEGSTETGKPNGNVLVAPQYLSGGRTISHFIATHPMISRHVEAVARPAY